MFLFARVHGMISHNSIRVFAYSWTGQLVQSHTCMLSRQNAGNLVFSGDVFSTGPDILACTPCPSQVADAVAACGAVDLQSFERRRLSPCLL
jgi:hypothetical protein